ncbi:hypothetical protein QTP86_020994 [Hemibagrus guttatus]|nr:hypothetical protein QTP86_020994 [Hemibagrus guttatus]
MKYILHGIVAKGMKGFQCYYFRYGETEVLATVSASKKACERTDTIPVDAVSYESYWVQLEFLMRLVKEATGALVNWERWIPTTERAELEGRVRKLKQFNNELEARTAMGSVRAKWEASAVQTQGQVIMLPNQMKQEENKALGTGYLVEEDKLYVMTSVNFSKRKKKMRTGQNLLEDEVKLKTPNPLTMRHLLSQVAGFYDPIGLVTPAKQKGAILVRMAFQETGNGSLTRQTWDKPLLENLRNEAMKLFEEYVWLGQVKFHRSLTPVDWKGKPWGITFSDGSDKTYGAVLYLRWETDQGVDVRLVESKAKLAPLDQKGDAIKAEICGAVFAVRLKKYFEKHGQMEVERWVHLVDS